MKFIKGINTRIMDNTRCFIIMIFLMSCFSVSASEINTFTINKETGLSHSFILKTYAQLKKDILTNTAKSLNLSEDYSNEFLKESSVSFPTTIKDFSIFNQSNKNNNASQQQFRAIMAGDCADIEFIDLRDVPGYPQLDDITKCGAADTLSMIIFTSDPGTVSGFEFELDLPTGIEYGGWEFAQLGGTSINIIDPEPSRPTFYVEGVTGDSLLIVNIGLRSTCDADISDELYLDFNYQYIYIDTFNTAYKCSNSITLADEVNSAVHTPVLNMLAPLTPAETEITSIGDPFCQTIEISQDGLNAYVDSFTFEINSLELFGGDLILASIEVNNTAYPLSNVAYDMVNQNSTFLIDGTYFPNNTLSNPADNQMNTNEIVSVEICYQTDICPSSSDIAFRYNAQFGCDGELCDISGQNTFLRIRPTGALLPTATAMLEAGGVEICGAPGMVSVTVTNPNTDTDQNVYTDLQIGFQLCDKPNLEISGVSVGGVPLPATAYTWEGDEINIDFQENTNTGLGLIDRDLDGFIDDLIGGATISAEILIEVVCSAAAAEDCAVIFCPDAQFYVDAKSNCGNSFKSFPVPDAFDLAYGARAVNNPTEAEFGTTGVFGYDFGTFSNDGSPIATTNASTVEVTFCYGFDKVNIEDCSTTADNYLQVSLAGDNRHMGDVEFVDGSGMISIDGGLNYTTIANSSYTKPDDNSALLILNEGSNADSVCYKYSLEMDSCICAPIGYFTANQQVVTSCSDCVGGCEILKACRQVTFKADPTCTPCDCIVQQDVVTAERKNLGYTDKTMTTRHTRESLIAAGGNIDLNRFMAGDTLLYEENYVILDTLALMNLLRWNFSWNFFSNTNTSWTSVPDLDLAMDSHASSLDAFQVSKPGSSTKTDIDLDGLTECLSDGVTNYGGAWSYFDKGKTPWENIDFVPSHDSSVDFADNNNLTLSLWNYDKIEECEADNAYFTGGNCLDEVIAAYSIAVGDTLHFRLSIPLIKNPHRAMARIAGLDATATNVARIYSVMTVYEHDPIAGDENYCQSTVGTACREDEPLYLDDSGGIDAITRLTLDNCSGQVTHEFTVKDFPGPPGDPWFTQEYRPYADIKRVEALVRAPLAYCANAEVTNLGFTYDVQVDSSLNMDCVPLSNYDEDVCAVNSDQTTGKVYFNLADQGVGALGIGFGNCDTMRLTYDLCMICPSDIPDIEDYELLYDWSFYNVPEVRDSREHRQYYCSISETTLTRTYCDDLGLAAGNYYYETYNLDTLMNKKNVSSETFFLTDNRDPQAPFTAENKGANLLASGSPGVSVEIQEIEICNTDTDDTATGAGAAVKIPSSVRLEDVYADAAGTTALTTDLISDDGEYKIYSVTLPSSTYAPSECTSIFIGTTLLFCPEPDETIPTICAIASAGCGPEDVRRALGASGGCTNSETCYAYVYGEVGLQTEWFDMPANPELCEEMTFNVRVKNVRTLPLLDLIPVFDLPVGLIPVSGTWEVSHPGGPTAAYDWQPILTDPDIVTGNTYSYSSPTLWDANIAANGLEGVSGANATADSNKVAFRFRATTDCDSFLSGSKMITETSAADPCGIDRVSSGFVNSPAVVLENADPEDFAQLLLVSEPDVLNCEGTINTFGITALNTGVESTSDSVLMCVTFPEDLDFQTGSLIFTKPNGFTPNDVTQTPLGTSNIVCFNAPQIGAYGSFSINFTATQDEDAPCGDIILPVDVKSFVDDVTCVNGAEPSCGVFVQNSLNNQVIIELAPPFIAENLNIYTDCAVDPTNTELYYEFEINHNGPNAVNQAYTVNLYEDTDNSQEINPNIDNLIGTQSDVFSVNDGATIMIADMIAVPTAQSCPILFEVIYDTDCACDRTQRYVNKIEYKGLKDLKDPISMCSGSCFDVEICSDMSVKADSIQTSTGVEYDLTINWGGLSFYTLPAPGGPDEHVTYEGLTNNSVLSDTVNVLFAEQSGTYGDGFLVASYSESVNVDKVFLGGGNISGWGNVIHVYSGVTMDFEYSDDGVNWTLAATSPKIPNGAFVDGTVIDPPVSGKYFRISSRGVRNWATSEFRLEGEGLPFQGQAPITRNGNTVTICVPEGDIGRTDPFNVEFTTGTGQCSVTEELEIWRTNSDDFVINAKDYVCENQCIDLEMVVPNDATTGMTIAWSPANMVEDPTAFRTEACNLTSDVTFTATVTYNNGDCIESPSKTINFEPENTINITGFDTDCYNVNTPTELTADSGWDIYNWYLSTPTANYVAFSSSNNTFTPELGQTYYLNATRNDVLCPAVGRTFTTPSEPCEDYPDYREGSTCDEEPCHTISNDIYLGTTVTNENASSGSSSASMDEDNGVALGSNLNFVPGNTMNLPVNIYNVTGNDAYLRTWIDWNGDGDFNDGGEQTIDYTYDYTTYNGSFTVNIPVGIPIGAAQGEPIAMRFRLSTDAVGSSDPCGAGTCAGDGEIEDYLMRVECPTGNCAKVGVTLMRK